MEKGQARQEHNAPPDHITLGDNATRPRRGLRRLIVAPHFHDPDATRAAAVLAPLLSLLCIGLVVLATVAIGIDTVLPWQVLAVFLSALIIGVMRGMVELGRVREAAWVTTVVLHLVAMSALLNDDTPSTYPIVFALTIVVAGFTVRRPNAFVWGTIAALAILGVTILQQRGVIVLRRPAENLVMVMSQVLSMLFLSAVVYWVNRALETARARAAAEEKTSTKLMQTLFRARRMESIGRLAGGVAHDFNNLLTVVTANASLLLEVEGLDDDDRDACRAMIKAAESGAHLSQQLLTFGGRHVSNVQRLDPAEVIQDFRAVLEHMGEKNDVRFVLATGAGCINCDPGRLQQAVANLIVNASHATEAGGNIEVSTAAFTAEQAKTLPHAVIAAGQYMIVRVRDSGCGMDAATVASALEPFFTTREIGEGSGLGLAVVQGVVSQAGGYVEVESALGHGTTVSLWFPRAEGATQFQPTPAPFAVAEVLVGTRVLVVDDNEQVREVTARTLRHAAADVDTADGGERALALLATNVYDVALIDVAMPGMSGPELATEIQARGVDVAMVFLTGYAEPEELRSSAVASVPLLYKPASTDDLIAAVLAACRKVNALAAS